MSPANELVKSVLSDMHAVLKPAGFKIGQNFKRETPESMQYVNLQRSSSSTATRVRLTVNVASDLKAIRRWLGATRPVQGYTDCHFRRRIGQYAGSGDQWWNVFDQRSADLAGAEIRELLTTLVLPDLDRLSKEEGLEQFYVAGGWLEVDAREYFESKGVVKD